jgi:hypothetical protein
MICAAVSMLACLGSGALWVRSYWSSDYLGRVDADRRAWVGALSMSGILRIERGQYATGYFGWQFSTAAPSSLQREIDARDRAGGRLLHRLGFAYARIDYNGGNIRRALYLPHWAMFLAAALLPADWLRRTIRQRRQQKTGLCPECGYDLRATPDRCPECGAAVAST